MERITHIVYKLWHQYSISNHTHCTMLGKITRYCHNNTGYIPSRYNLLQVKYHLYAQVNHLLSNHIHQTEAKTTDITITMNNKCTCDYGLVHVITITIYDK